MPSFEHEILVQLFHECPELARILLRMCAGVDIAEGAPELGTADLSQLVSTEYRADGVIVFRDSKEAIAAVIVEVQRDTDAAKRWTWPVYVATLRALLRCRVVLLVLAPDQAVARWARARIEIGHPGFALEPIVLDYASLPRVTDPALAARVPELAVLSAIAHEDLEVVQTALDVVRRMPEEPGRVYFDVILKTHPEIARQLLEAYVKGYEYQSDFAKHFISEGREAGREEAAIMIARTKLEEFSVADDRAIRSTRGAALDDLIVSLARARDAVETRAVLDRLTSNAD